jgi:hypothetical protein
MPRAVPYATRQEIVRRHLDGQTLLRIAADLHLPLATVRDLWRAFRDHGDDGLVIRDPACGRSTPGHHRHVLRRACQLKRRRPTWGAGRVRVELLGLLAATLVPSARTLQRAFQRRRGSTAPGGPSGRELPELGPRRPTTSGRWTLWRRSGSRPACWSAG